MSKNESDSPQKPKTFKKGNTKNPTGTKAFLDFRQTVDKEIERAILDRMKTFREDILKSKLSKIK